MKTKNLLIALLAGVICCNAGTADASSLGAKKRSLLTRPSYADSPVKPLDSRRTLGLREDVIVPEVENSMYKEKLLNEALFPFYLDPAFTKLEASLKEQLESIIADPSANGFSNAVSKKLEEVISSKDVEDLVKTKSLGDFDEIFSHYVDAAKHSIYSSLVRASSPVDNILGQFEAFVSHKTKAITIEAAIDGLKSGKAPKEKINREVQTTISQYLEKHSFVAGLRDVVVFWMQDDAARLIEAKKVRDEFATFLGTGASDEEEENEIPAKEEDEGELDEVLKLAKVTADE